MLEPRSLGFATIRSSVLIGFTASTRRQWAAAMCESAGLLFLTPYAARFDQSGTRTLRTRIAPFFRAVTPPNA